MIKFLTIEQRLFSFKGVNAVSYTHLDVYKRQIYTCVIVEVQYWYKNDYHYRMFT